MSPPLSLLGFVNIILTSFFDILSKAEKQLLIFLSKLCSSIGIGCKVKTTIGLFNDKFKFLLISEGVAKLPSLIKSITG